MQELQGMQIQTIKIDREFESKAPEFFLGLIRRAQISIETDVPEIQPEMMEIIEV